MLNPHGESGVRRASQSGDARRTQQRLRRKRGDVRVGFALEVLHGSRLPAESGSRALPVTQIVDFNAGAILRADAKRNSSGPKARPIPA